MQTTNCNTQPARNNPSDACARRPKGRKTSPFSPTLRLTMIAVMTAIATVIYLFLPDVPIVPGVEYLKIDFSDFPALLLGLMMGPAEGIAVGLIKNIFHLVRTTTVGIGELINFGIVTAMVLSLWGFSRLFGRLLKKDTLHPAPYFTAAVLTIGVTILAGWGLNLVLTPLYYRLMGWPLNQTLLLTGIWGSTLLNAIKGALNVLPFYPVFLGLSRIFQKQVQGGRRSA